MLSVTKVYDQPGWAYDFIAREMARYSRYKLRSQSYDNIDYQDQDIVIVSGPDILYKKSAIQIPWECKKRGIKVIGQYCGEVDMVYTHADLIVTISPQLYLFAKKRYKDIPVIFLPESIDTNYFQPSEIAEDRFVPGWAGGMSKPIKRAYLFAQMNYPIKVISEHGDAFFKEGRTQDKMKEFYKSIDCFVSVSETECMPRVLLEAMACGLPVISSDVGGVPLLIPHEYIVPVYPEAVCVNEVNKRLDLLANSLELRKNIGRINREYCENLWSWQNNMPVWDEVFYHLYHGDMDKVLRIGDSCIERFKDYFEPCEKYRRQIAHFRVEWNSFLWEKFYLFKKVLG